MSDTSIDLPAEAHAALLQGRTIEAIQIVRLRQGTGLKEAKDAVDAYLRAHPETRSRADAARAEGNPRALLWVAALLMAAVAAFLLARPR
jgi:hypothetical protein